ncbi:MAG: DUF5060 domain-containing protein [Candidatus Manganitrophaceae bacterium]
MKIKSWSWGLFFQALVILAGVLLFNALENAAPTWQPVEITFTATGTPDWKTFPLSVTFTHTDGTKITLEGFWDGGNVWRVRFAPIKDGRWSWASVSSNTGLNGKSGFVDVAAPTAIAISQNPNLRGHLHIAGDNRTFNRADGSPFFYLGDTGWGAMTKTYALFKSWVDDRRTKGFTVVQIRYGSPLKSTNPNRQNFNEGGYPFLGTPLPDGSDTKDYSRINPAYFQQVDARMNYLFENGFVIAGHPDWITISDSYDLDGAENYSRYLIARYGAYPLVWSLSGEYQSAVFDWYRTDYENVRDLGSFIKTKNAYKHPMSIHPGGYHANPTVPLSNMGSSAHHFHTETWLDHNWLQTYSYFHHIPYRIDEALSKIPAKPVINTEGDYEGNEGDIPNRASAQRLQAWTSYLSGAAGYVYGARGVYFLDDLTGADPPSGLNLPGSSDMSRIISFFTQNTITLSAMNPRIAGGQSCVTIGGQNPSLLDVTHARCAGTAGSVYVLYAPAGSASHNLEMRGLENKSYIAKWYNPATGIYTDVIENPVNTDLNDTWTVPSRPSLEDWVLYLKENGGGTGGTSRVRQRSGINYS